MKPFPRKNAISALLTVTLMWATAVNADDLSEKEILVTKLDQAKMIILEAEREAEAIILEAKQHALRLKPNDVNLNPLLLQNSKIAVEISGGTIEQIVSEIMPSNWRVMVDVKELAIAKRKFQFVSNRTREQALNDLLLPIGMKHQYFFDLKDAQGNDSPLLVVSLIR